MKVTVEELADIAEIERDLIYKALSGKEISERLMNRLRNVRTIWLMKRQISLYEDQRTPVDSEREKPETPIDLTEIYQLHEPDSYAHAHVEHQIFAHIQSFLNACDSNPERLYWFLSELKQRYPTDHWEDQSPQ